MLTNNKIDKNDIDRPINEYEDIDNEDQQLVSGKQTRQLNSNQQRMRRINMSFKEKRESRLRKKSLN